ncbi:MAG: sigma-54-dependent Fis family transcriptional regulator [Gemmatimonadetes bacterium]|nr:sigma-54-dependent Fis family transcriptional regulator [Gemmatimonadota bacterium]
MTAPTGPLVLVVDDDANVRAMLSTALTGEGYRVQSAESGEDALKAMSRELYDLVLLDLELPRMSGLAVLEEAPRLQGDAQFIILTGAGSVATAVEAIKLGAFDYLQKPPSLAELGLVMDRALADRDRRRELARLRLGAKEGKGHTLIGDSLPMRRLRAELARVAPTRATVLISGETGTGKELVAQTIHALSDRAAKPFVAVNCSALPEGVLESELFGHLRGSFTGAVASRRGLFEEAADGTLFLDEVGTLAPGVQVKLLRVLQERRVQRVGGGLAVPVDFRLVAATNVDLAAEVAAGRFREDLYFRLNVVPIRVPPLRERGNDILLLAAHFRSRYAEEFGITPPDFSPALVQRLLQNRWRGNVRQLENVIQRAVIMHSSARAIPVLPLEDPVVTPESELLDRAASESWNLDRVEREYILLVLERQEGHLGRTAAFLGIDRRTLYRKLRDYQKGGHLAALPAQES